MKDTKTYSEKLLDSRWIVIRDRVLLRDHHFCQKCGSTINLNVHHKFYVMDKDPWEYEDFVLVTLCEMCHETAHSTSNDGLLKLRLNNLSNEFVFNFTKSVLEINPLFITLFNTLSKTEKDRCLYQFSEIIKDKLRLTSGVNTRSYVPDDEDRPF